jgi:hypothetical protein
LCRGGALTHSTDKQHHLLGTEIASLKHGATVQVVNPATVVTPIHVQFTPFGASEPPRLLKRRLAMWTVHTIWVKIVSYPGEARLAIH